MNNTPQAVRYSSQLRMARSDDKVTFIYAWRPEGAGWFLFVIPFFVIASVCMFGYVLYRLQTRDLSPAIGMLVLLGAIVLIGMAFRELSLQADNKTMIELTPESLRWYVTPTKTQADQVIPLSELSCAEHVEYEVSGVKGGRRTMYKVQAIRNTGEKKEIITTDWEKNSLQVTSEINIFLSRSRGESPLNKIDA